VATRRIPDTYKPKPNPYLKTNPNPNPTNPTSILCKDYRKTLPCIQFKVYQNTFIFTRNSPMTT